MLYGRPGDAASSALHTELVRLATATYDDGSCAVEFLAARVGTPLRDAAVDAMRQLEAQQLCWQA